MSKDSKPLSSLDQLRNLTNALTDDPAFEKEVSVDDREAKRAEVFRQKVVRSVRSKAEELAAAKDTPPKRQR